MARFVIVRGDDDLMQKSIGCSKTCRKQSNEIDVEDTARVEVTPGKVSSTKLHDSTKTKLEA